MITSKKYLTTRRNFLSASAAAVVAAAPAMAASRESRPAFDAAGTSEFPVKVISSGNGLEATRKAYGMIVDGADVLDGVVAGVNLVEEDPNDTSVGYGGLPNERGVVQLDSAVMHGPTHQAGAVACIENIKYPSQVAKLVLWRTNHVLLVGKGATEFAVAHGHKEEDLLTERARQIWLKWKETMSDRDDWLPPADSADKKFGSLKNPADAWRYEHGVYDNGEDIAILAERVIQYRPTGTIHCSGMDSQGNISCVTTTSGLAFKIPGRVGDSPIIGAGLYCDNEIGSCGSTGLGEANLQNLCSFTGVELMRSGMTPEEAGLEVLRRVAKHSIPRLRNEQGEPNFGLQFYLIRKDGLHAGVTMRGKGKFAVTDQEGTRHEDLVALYA